jgi:hypothetical protein
MSMINKPSILAFVLVNIIATWPSKAAETPCTQNQVDGTTIPTTKHYVFPAQSVVPFYQWENDNGYCGEVSMMQAGLNNGQWISQYNARLVCGVGLAQSGPPANNDSWCSNHKNIPDYNAQLLIEDQRTDVVVTGTNPYARAAVCLANSRLSGTTYPYWKNNGSTNVGLPGYMEYMSWVKSEVIAGHQVTVGVLVKYGSDPQYDHEVSVYEIGTNYDPTDPTFHPDDVLYFDDHGGYTLVGKNLNKGNPAIPYGAGADTTGCTPYKFGYTFGSLPQTRKAANVGSAQAYSIIIPGVSPTYTSTGENGYLETKAITGHNYGFSVSGAMDNSNGGPSLLPIQLSIIGPTYTNLLANPQDPIADWQYENSMIGTDIFGAICTNTAPQYPMKPMNLRVTVSGLTAGVLYNLYEYDPKSPAEIASKVPNGNFNYSYKNLNMGSRTQFQVPTGTTTFSKIVTTQSDQIVFFRAVPASAP